MQTKFGRWTIVSLDSKKANGGHKLFLCRCECGTERFIDIQNLKSGKSSSCGCLPKEINTKHGSSRQSPEYTVWLALRQRCDRTTHPQYPLYGGRGISYTKTWDDFSVFLRDVGKRPSPNHSLDRIDNNGNYEPGNVRWANRLTQMNNTRSNYIIHFRGESLTLTEWARRLGIKPNTLNHRIRKYGWSEEKALTTP